MPATAVAGGNKKTPRPRRIVRATAVAGMAGPALFAAVLLALTALQYDFLLGIGWRPLRDPAGAWSSGLALGPYGWALTASFVVSGLLLMLFAAGLHLGAPDGRGSQFGPALLFTAGAAIALMGFETDSIRRTAPRTPHGLVHDLAFALFVLTLLPTYFFVAKVERRSPLAGSRPLHARYRAARRVVSPLAGRGLLSVSSRGTHMVRGHSVAAVAPLR